MLFSSQIFILGFLPAVLALYYAAAAHRRLRQIIVVAASLVFYGYWDIRFVPLLAGLTLANWILVYIYGKRRFPGLMIAGIALNLAVLGLFKYADFFRVNVAALSGEPFEPWNLILPLGISFFIFQKISYLADLQRGEKRIYGLLDFSMFVTFFPQLIAGPIVRHNEIIDQFAASPRRPEMWENLSRGFVLFLIGVFKKAAIADPVATIADPLFAKATTTALNAAEAWAAALAFTLQIYFDFSGYSDMAIGLALMFGFCLPINFNAPYSAKSIREFWQRWHMTLSRFLRDYLYIPLGGNRRGAFRRSVNLMITMLLGGLWHGAAWTFVAWGGLHGLGLAINHAWSRRGLKLPPGMGWLLTLLFVIVGWVLFRAQDFATAAGILRSMTGADGIGSVEIAAPFAFALGALLALFGRPSQDAVLKDFRPSPWLAAACGSALVFALLLLGGGIPKEFVYFQF